jgi:hypothetical protein
MVDYIDLMIVFVSDTLEDIFHQSKAKEETMFYRIEAELKGVQQALYSIHTVSTASFSIGDIEVGYDPAQLHRLEDSTKDHLHRDQ